MSAGKRRIGRPPLGVEKATAYLTSDQLDYICAVADLEHRSTSEVIRMLVDAGISTARVRKGRALR
jgi:hypothetical protein